MSLSKFNPMLSLWVLFAGLASCSPMIYGTEMMPVEQVRNLTTTVDRQMLIAYDCWGQSCLVADTAGSTGENPTMRAEGASDADIACIVKYNPVIGGILNAYGASVPEAPKQDTGASSSLIGGLNSIWRGFAGDTHTGSFTGTCAPNILIYAKGTLEPGNYGITVGPKITANLPPDWSTGYVSYDADVPGDYCLGLPGGMVAKDVINDAAQKCPQSKLFVSGYSQGAMVIRNGLARANDYAKSKVMGVVTFGDPFNGSPIRGYNGPIQVYCGQGDGVCTGNFEIGGAHLAYASDDSVPQAKQKLMEMARGQGDSSCCHPAPLPPMPSVAEWQASIAANGGVKPKAKPGTSVAEWAKALSESHGQIPEGTANSVRGLYAEDIIM